VCARCLKDGTQHPSETVSFKEKEFPFAFPARVNPSGSRVCLR